MSECSSQKFWHGGRYPQSGVLTPQPLMRSGREGDGFGMRANDEC